MATKIYNQTLSSGEAYSSPISIEQRLQAQKALNQQLQAGGGQLTQQGRETYLNQIQGYGIDRSLSNSYKAPSTTTKTNTNKNVSSASANNNFGRVVAGGGNNDVKPFDNQTGTNMNGAAPIDSSQFSTATGTGKQSGYTGFYTGDQIVNITDQNRKELFNRAYGTQNLDINGQITRLGQNGQQTTTGGWKAASPNEQIARQMLVNTGGIGQENPEWQQFATQDPQAAQDAYNWWINNETAPRGGATATTPTTPPPSPTDSVVSDLGASLGVSDTYDPTMNSMFQEFFNAIEDKISARLDMADATILSAKQQIDLYKNRQTDIEGEFAIDKQQISQAFNDQQLRLDQQKRDLDESKRIQSEQQLGMLAISQAGRGVSGITTSFARQEISNTVDNINREYSMSLDRINLQKQETLHLYERSIHDLNKQKAEIMFNYDSAIGDLTTKMNMATPEAKATIADIRYNAISDFQSIQQKELEKKIMVDDANMKLDAHQKQVEQARFDNLLKLSEQAGYAVGMSEYGIPDGIPIGASKTTSGLNANRDILGIDYETYMQNGGGSELEYLMDTVNANSAQKTADERNKYTSAINAIRNIQDIQSRQDISPQEKEILKNNVYYNVAKNSMATASERDAIESSRKILERKDELVNKYNELLTALEPIYGTDSDPMTDDLYLVKSTADYLKNGGVLTGIKDTIQRNISAGASRYTSDQVIEAAKKLNEVLALSLQSFSAEKLKLTGATLTPQEEEFVRQFLPMDLTNLSSFESLINKSYSAVENTYDDKMTFGNNGLSLNYSDYVQQKYGDQDIQSQGFSKTEQVSKLPGRPSNFVAQAGTTNNNPSGLKVTDKKTSILSSIMKAGVDFFVGGEPTDGTGGKYFAFKDIDTAIKGYTKIFKENLSNMTVSGALANWVGTSEGKSYASTILNFYKERTGSSINPNTKIAELSDNELQELLKAQLKKENINVYKKIYS